MRRSLALTAVLLAGGLAACGGDDDGGASGSADGVQIVMKTIDFAPKQATAAVGEKVTWTNEDSAQHDVAPSKDEFPKSEVLDKGQTFSYTPTEAGRIDYICTIHPSMKASLTVTG